MLVCQLRCVRLLHWLRGNPTPRYFLYPGAADCMAASYRFSRALPPQRDSKSRRSRVESSQQKPRRQESGGPSLPVLGIVRTTYVSQRCFGANVPYQRPRASDAWHATETQSRGSLHPSSFGVVVSTAICIQGENHVTPRGKEYENEA